MKIYMLINTTAMLLFTPQQPTTLQFSSPIEYYAIGHRNDFDNYLTKNKKILLLHPKKEKFDEFLVVITQKHSYEFRIKSTPKKFSALYQILNATRDKLYTLKKRTQKYKLLEGLRFLKIERTKGDFLIINGQKSTQRIIYYPKNAYLSINGQEWGR